MRAARRLLLRRKRSKVNELRRALAKTRLTHALLAIMIAVFALELSFPGLLELLAFSPAQSGAHPWTAVTALFAHADLEHIVANLVVLWFFGLAVEKELGRKRTGLIFLLGGFAGEAASALLYDPDVLSLGASAGAFALIGAAALVRPFELEAGGGWPMVSPLPLVLLAMVYVGYNLIGVFLGPADIAYGAHFAGLAAGLAAGWFCRKQRL